MSSRALVNGRFLTVRATGVQRYAAEILARRSPAVEARVISPSRPLGKIAGHFWEQFRLPQFRKSGEILWSPANTGPLSVAAQVVTIHDAATLDHPEWFDPMFARWYRFLLPRLMRRVRRVLTVSRFSKARLLEYANIPENRIQVVPPGVDGMFQSVDAEAVAEVRDRLGLPPSYVLAVGSIEPRKNLAGLLRAWENLRSMGGEVDLLVAGGEGRVFRGPGFGRIPAGVTFLGYVEPGDLPALYTGARAFVCPSWYEGFGLPVLEAMACGTPVVCSNTTALPEAAGDAAILVDPSSAESIARGLQRALEDGALRTELRRHGLERARQFGWDRSAESTWRALEEAGE